MQDGAVETLLEELRSEDAELRRAAWLQAAQAGPEAVEPLGRLMATGEMEVSRSAERAIKRLARDLGAPGVEASTKRRVVDQLLLLVTEEFPEDVRRLAIWLFSELADPEDAESMAFLLEDETLREDARCALERIPGRPSIQLLWAALEEAPKDFQMNIVQSLRARGETVSGYPCRKLTPR